MTDPKYMRPGLDFAVDCLRYTGLATPILVRIDAVLSAASGEASGDGAAEMVRLFNSDAWPNPASRPAPSEAPNVERATSDIQAQAERPPSVSDNFSANEIAWLDLVEKDDRTSPAEYPDHALISREELFAALDSARAEGIAAMRECAVKITEDIPCSPRIAAAIREAKP